MSEHSGLLNSNTATERQNSRRWRSSNSRLSEHEENQRLLEITRTHLTETEGSSSRDRTILEEICRIISNDSSVSDSSVPENQSSRGHSVGIDTRHRSDDHDHDILTPEENLHHPGSETPPPSYASIDDADNLPTYEEFSEHAALEISLQLPENNIPDAQLRATVNGTSETEIPPPSYISVLNPDPPPSYGSHTDFSSS